MTEESKAKRDTVNVDGPVWDQVSESALSRNYDDAVQLAAHLCEVPYAYVAFFDGDGQILRSALGVSEARLPWNSLLPSVESKGCWECADIRALGATDSAAFPACPSAWVFFAAVPLITSNSQCVGFLCVGDGGPRTLSQRQRDGLAIVARQIVGTVERERQTDVSFEALSAQKEALKERSDNFQFLHDLGEATRALTSPEAIMDTSARMLGEHLKVSRCAYAEVGADNNQFTILHDYTRDCGSTVGTYALEAFGPRAASELRRNKVLVIRDVDAELRADEGAETFRSIDIAAIVTCPLVKDDGLRAMMAVHQTAPRHWTSNEIFLVQEVVERCWSTIERARAEVAVNQSQEQFHNLFEFAPDAIIMADENGNIALLNRQAEEMFGYTRAELIGQPIEVLMPEGSRRAHVGLRKAFYKNAVPRSMGAGRTNLRGLHRDGHSFSIDISLSPLLIGNQTWVAAAVRDTTEREQFQAHTLRAQRLESIGTLAGGVAHDLNNALAPILMATEVMRLEQPDDLELIEAIESSAKRGAAMVRQLLTFAKGVEGERMLIQPHRLLQEMTRIIQRTFPKTIQLRSAIGTDLSPILGDTTQLHQVLLNLCVNARDAMPDGGVITLRAENIEIDEAYASSIPDASTGPYVVIRVTDTGQGIPPAVMDRIFEPFYSTKGPDGGTGLGLSTVLGIVKSHGGFMEAYSRPDRGASFSVYLKAGFGDVDVDSAAQSVASSFTGNGELILVVDDEPTVRETASRVLEAMNFTTITAVDGTQALIKAAENRAHIRVVLTDLHMPHVDGLTLAQALRQMLPEVGVIMMSGRLEDREATELRSIGITSLLNKPFTREKLIEALKNVMSR